MPGGRSILSTVNAVCFPASTGYMMASVGPPRDGSYSADGVAAGALGEVERLVGLVEQVVEAVGAGPMGAGDADAQRDRRSGRGSPASASAGAAMPARNRAARATADSGRQAGATITNSSPAYRPTTSLSRTELASTAAVRRSASSPAAWPCVSLISLNRSRSTIRIDRLVPCRRDDSQWRRSWSSRAPRLIRPVRLSRYARRSRRSHPLADPQRRAEPRQQLGVAGQGRQHVEGAQVEGRRPLLGGRAAAVQDHGDPGRRRRPAPAAGGPGRPAADARGRVPPGQDQARPDASPRPAPRRPGRRRCGPPGRRPSARRTAGTVGRRGLDQQHATRGLGRRPGPFRPAVLRSVFVMGIGRRFAGHRRRHGHDSRFLRIGQSTSGARSADPGGDAPYAHSTSRQQEGRSYY